jgi:hypothetical protein
MRLWRFLSVGSFALRFWQFVHLLIFDLKVNLMLVFMVMRVFASANKVF